MFKSRAMGHMQPSAAASACAAAASARPACAASFRIIGMDAACAVSIFLLAELLTASILCAVLVLAAALVLLARGCPRPASTRRVC